MKNFSVHDFIIPTNPMIAFFFGCLITVIVSIIVYVETKDLKVVLYTVLITVVFLAVLVFALYVFGFYHS